MLKLEWSPCYDELPYYSLLTIYWICHGVTGLLINAAEGLHVGYVLDHVICAVLWRQTNLPCNGIQTLCFNLCNNSHEMSKFWWRLPSTNHRTEWACCNTEQPIRSQIRWRGWYVRCCQLTLFFRFSPDQDMLV